MAAYISKPGSVILHMADGTAQSFGYGQEVDVDALAEHQKTNIDQFVSKTRPSGVDIQPSLAELQQEAAKSDNPAFRAAMVDAGQPNSSASPVPSNYGDLSEDEAIRFIQTLEFNPAQQAAVLAYEAATEGRSKVLASGSSTAQEEAEVIVANEASGVVPSEDDEGPTPAPSGSGPDATDAAVAKAEELGVDLAGVTGTGADGRITVGDVEAATSDDS